MEVICTGKAGNKVIRDNEYELPDYYFFFFSIILLML